MTQEQRQIIRLLWSIARNVVMIIWQMARIVWSTAVIASMIILVFGTDDQWLWIKHLIAGTLP